MAERAIEWLHGVRAQDARKPFFIYFSTGCSHAPHHVAQAWAEKYKGRLSRGIARRCLVSCGTTGTARRRSAGFDYFYGFLGGNRLYFRPPSATRV